MIYKSNTNTFTTASGHTINQKNVSINYYDVLKKDGLKTIGLTITPKMIGFHNKNRINITSKEMAIRLKTELINFLTELNFGVICSYVFEKKGGHNRQYIDIHAHLIYRSTHDNKLRDAIGEKWQEPKSISKQVSINYLSKRSQLVAYRIAVYKTGVWTRLPKPVPIYKNVEKIPKVQNKKELHFCKNNYVRLKTYQFYMDLYSSLFDEIRVLTSKPRKNASKSHIYHKTTINLEEIKYTCYKVNTRKSSKEKREIKKQKLELILEARQHNKGDPKTSRKAIREAIRGPT